MAIQVTCGSDIVLNYSAGAQSTSLSATATGGTITSWRWDILGVPSGVNTNLNSGDFISGVALVQNPSFTTGGGVMGTYVFQCTASDGITTNVIQVDRANAQQNVIVKTQNLGLSLPSDGQYDWAVEDLRNIVALSGVWPTTISGINRKLTDAVLDPSTASRNPAQHALAGSAHSSTTLANLNAKITDATLDTSTTSRPPTGTAGGHLSGTYPGPTVAKIGNIPLNITGAASGQFISYNTSNNQWQPLTLPTSFSGLSDAPANYLAKKYQILGVNQGETGTSLAPLMTGWRQNWPWFTSSGGCFVTISGRKGFSNTLQLRLNDGKMYTVTAPLRMTYTSTGYLGRDITETRLGPNFWHIYAVPSTTANQMSFVMSQNNPVTTAGPTGFPINKYCWTVKTTKASGIFPFNQQGKWNYYTQGYDWATQSGQALIWRDNAGIAYKWNRWWWPMDGTRHNGDLSMQSYSGVQHQVPMNIADSVQFHTFVRSRDYAGIGLTIAPGSGVGSSGILWRPLEMGTSCASGLGDYHNMVQESGNGGNAWDYCHSLTMPTFGVDPQSLMFSWYWAEYGCGNGNAGTVSCTVAGYRNAMYGDFYAEDD